MDIIVDIDGTIANGEHREHLLKEKPKKWKEWAKSMELDTTHDDIIYLIKLLFDAGNRIILCTGRNEMDRQRTMDWLAKQGILPIGVIAAANAFSFAYDRLYMRDDHDHRPDSIVKIEKIEEMKIDGYNPVLAFDDRNRVVEAWREAGIRCLQVREGNF